MSNTRRVKKKGLREALAAKQVRTAHWDVPLANSETSMTAAKALQSAKQTEFVANLGDDAELKKAAKLALDQAQAAFDQCAYRIELRAIPDADRDALRNEFPDDPAVVKVSEDPFSYALLAASVVGDTMTGQEWQAEMTSDRWRDTDRVELISLVLDVNFRPFSHGIPKG